MLYYSPFVAILNKTGLLPLGMPLSIGDSLTVILPIVRVFGNIEVTTTVVLVVIVVEYAVLKVGA